MQRVFLTFNAIRSEHARVHNLAPRPSSQATLATSPRSRSTTSISASASQSSLATSSSPSASTPRSTISQPQGKSSCRARFDWVMQAGSIDLCGGSPRRCLAFGFRFAKCKSGCTSLSRSFKPVSRNRELQIYQLLMI